MPAAVTQPGAPSIFERVPPRFLVLGAGVGCAASMLVAALANSLSPVTAAIGVVGAAVAIAMVGYPQLAVLMVCLSIPFERIGRLTNDNASVAVSVSRILGLIGILSLLVDATFRKKKLRFGLPVWLYAGYTALALASNAWAWSPEETFRDCFRIVGNLLFFFMLWNLIRTYADCRRAVMVWLIASMAAAGYSLGDYYLTRNNPISEREMGLVSTRMSAVVSDGSEARSLGMNVRRLFGTTAHPTLFGLNNTFTLPFLIWAMRARRGWERLLWGAGFLLAIACIVLSNTRAVFLVAAFTLLFAVLRGLARLNLRLILAAIVLAAVAAPFIPADVYRRSLDPALYTTENGDSIRVRFKFWAKSWELIGETWTHGIGVGNLTTLEKRITDEDTGYLSTQGLRASAHNEYIWEMVELGLGGYALFWGFVAAVTRAGFQAGRLLRRQARTDRQRAEQYWFLVACQILMVGVLLFAVQSEAFHYPLKGWWLTAAVSCSMLAWARQEALA